LLHEASPVGYHSAGTMRMMCGIAYPASTSLYSSSSSSSDSDGDSDSNSNSNSNSNSDSDSNSNSNSNSNNKRVQHVRTKWPS
jgi:hypothetical protein